MDTTSMGGDARTGGSGFRGESQRPANPPPLPIRHAKRVRGLHCWGPLWVRVEVREGEVIRYVLRNHTLRDKGSDAFVVSHAFA